MYILERSGVRFDEKFYTGYKQHVGALWGTARKAQIYSSKDEAQAASERIEDMDGIYTRVSDRSDFI